MVRYSISVSSTPPFSGGVLPARRRGARWDLEVLVRILNKDGSPDRRRHCAIVLCTLKTTKSWLSMKWRTRVGVNGASMSRAPGGKVEANELAAIRDRLNDVLSPGQRGFGLRDAAAFCLDLRRALVARDVMEA